MHVAKEPCCADAFNGSRFCRLNVPWHVQIEEKKRKEREALLAAPPAPATKEAPSAFGAARRPGAPRTSPLHRVLIQRLGQNVMHMPFTGAVKLKAVMRAAVLRPHVWQPAMSRSIED